MRYIRTKDGVFEVSELNDYATHHRKGMTLTVVKYVSNNKILKQADTIEELCDEFVIPKFRDVFVIDRFSKQICINHIKCGNGDVYGAIWTDKGLIYVAKLNKNGEFELI